MSDGRLLHGISSHRPSPPQTPGFQEGSQRYELALRETRNLKRCKVTEDNPVSFDTEVLERKNSSCGNEVEIEKIQREKIMKINSIN